MNNSVRTFETLQSFKAFLKNVKPVPSNINRKVDIRNVKALKASILQYGIQRDIILVETSAFTGTKTLYTLDGQHLKNIFDNIEDNVVIEGTLSVRINYSENIPEIINLMSTLNSTGKKWGLIDYAKAFANAGNVHYKGLLELRKATKIGLNALIECYQGKEGGNPTFKAGNFLLVENSHSLAIKRIYEEALALGLPKSDASFAAVVRFYNDTRPRVFDEQAFYQSIRLNVERFKICRTRDSFKDLFK